MVHTEERWVLVRCAPTAREVEALEWARWARRVLGDAAEIMVSLVRTACIDARPSASRSFFFGT